MYLLDSDWVIQALANRQPAVHTLERLAGSRTYVSYITVGEVYERAFDSINHQATWSVFVSFSVPTASSPSPIPSWSASLRCARSYAGAASSFRTSTF